MMFVDWTHGALVFQDCLWACRQETQHLFEALGRSNGVGLAIKYIVGELFNIQTKNKHALDFFE